MQYAVGVLRKPVEPSALYLKTGELILDRGAPKPRDRQSAAPVL
jgi:hypothetical protein